MVNLPYSGQVSRAAHYDYRPPVPGLNPDHTTGAVEPDPFNPVPDQVPGQDGTVWTVTSDEAAAGPSGYRSLAEIPVDHWYAGQNAVQSGLPYGAAQQAMQERMMVDHAPVNFVPDQYRIYQHASEGQQFTTFIGRPSQYAGETISGPLAGLADGRNGYDQTNLPNEVYAGDDANVGRYRLGRRQNWWGTYQFPIGKFGQDASLRAYTGITPTFPAEKHQFQETAAPYTPNSSGATAYWAPAQANQIPTAFGLPSETAMTDFATQTGDDGSYSDFENGGRL